MAAIELTDTDLQSILTFSVHLAKYAGSVILEGSKAVLAHTAVSEKKNSVDLVTEWDVKVEEIVRGEIKKTYPHFKFIGEESYVGQPLTDEPTFCVDPIDGTTNFVHGFPFSCLSIGLIYKKKPVMGVIYCPFLDQMYTGLKGHGSFLNQTERLPLIPARALPTLSSALIGIEWGSGRNEAVMRPKLATFARLASDSGKMVHGLRSLGSAALNYGFVARGSLDLYWEIGCWPWDVCAGIVIAEEAGGMVSGAKSSPHDGEVTEDLLTGRKYIVVRAIADTPHESGRDAQKRIIKEFYETVEEWDAD